MAEPRILSVCWIPKNSLKIKPDRVEIENEEKIKILKEAAAEANLDESGSENELDDQEEMEEKTKQISLEKKESRPEMTEEESKVWDEFNLDDYDDEDDDLVLRIGSLVDQSNNEDGYDPDLAEIDEEDEEDIVLTADDHVLLAGTDGQDGTAAVEVRIFNKNEEYYVRNDISLSGPPLCLCYVHTEIGEAAEEDMGDAENTEYSSNFVAIGSITNEIQIWDLDLIDAPGPSYNLKGHKKGSSVVSLSWDGNRSLISGGTDGRVLLWSLDDGSKIGIGKETNQNIMNQTIFVNQKRIITGDNVGICRIYDHDGQKWHCTGEIDVGEEIEKIACSSNSFAIGTSKGVISIISLDTLKMTVRWKAYSEQPITALEFKSTNYLFSGGHEPACDLILWNISKHLTSDNNNSIPLPQYKRRRHKQSGRMFCGILCPEVDSDFVLVGGESGGAQVLRLSIQSKKNSGDSDSEDEDDENAEDAGEITKLEEEDWETDSGSSEGEEIQSD